MKKMKIILFGVMIMGLILGCGSNGDDNRSRSSNIIPAAPAEPIGTTLLVEITNPPKLEENESIHMIVDNKTIITKNANDKYYLLTDIYGIWDRNGLPDNTDNIEKFNDKTLHVRTYDDDSAIYLLYVYDGVRWNEEELAANCVGVVQVCNDAFIAHYIYMPTSDVRMTLHIYDEINNKWEEHSELRDRKSMEEFYKNAVTVTIEDSAFKELWAYQDGEWVRIIDEFASYDQVSMSCYLFSDVDYTISFWQYANSRWNKIVDFEIYSAIRLNETFVLLEYTLWAYKNGEWGPYAPSADIKFIWNGKHLYDYAGKEFWVSINTDWAPINGLKKFLKSNPDKVIISFTNDNSILIKDINTKEYMIYDASFTEYTNASRGYASDGFMVINENAMILYSKAHKKFVLLEYDVNAKNWHEGSFMSSAMPMWINENSFFSKENKEFWVFEDGEWKILVAECYDIQKKPVCLVISTESKPNVKSFYMYDGSRWTKIFEADSITPYSDDILISSEGAGLAVWHYNGKRWKLIRTFLEADYLQEPARIQSADGRLYYFDR